MQKANTYFEFLTLQRLSCNLEFNLDAEEIPQRPTTSVPLAKFDLMHDGINEYTFLCLLSWFYSAKEFFTETRTPIHQRTNANIQKELETTIQWSLTSPNLKMSGFYAPMINQLVKILQEAFNDNHKDSWIEYYLWELEFGKNYKKGIVTNKDGSNIDLSNAGKLYDFLTTKYPL